jgi:hypothetical protein
VSEADPLPPDPAEVAYEKGRAQYGVALERLIACAEFLVNREIEEGFDLSLWFSGQIVFSVARQAFLDADRGRSRLGYAKAKGRGYRPVPAPRESDLAAASLHRDVMIVIAARWDANEQWFEDVEVDDDGEEIGMTWPGLIYPADCPVAPKYQILPRELELLRGALRLLRLPEPGEPMPESKRIDGPPWKVRPSIAAFAKDISLGDRSNAAFWKLHKAGIINLVKVPRDGAKPSYVKLRVLRPELLRGRWKSLINLA